jgi:dienelactone hydrolase
MSAARASFEFRLDDERDPLRRIRGSIERPPLAGSVREPLPYVLILHGFKGFMDWGFFPELARRIAQRGIAAVRFNFSGSGVGERADKLDDDAAFEANTPSRELEDVERVRAFLDSGAVPWLDPSRGGLFGHSLGGALALLHAARRRDYHAIVAWAAVVEFQRFGPEVAEQWRARGFIEIPNLRTGQIHRLGVGWLEDIERNAAALDPLAACARLAAPALFLHGSADETVPLAESERLAASFSAGLADLRVLAGANHTFGAVHPLVSVPPALETAFTATGEAFASRLLGTRAAL